MIRRTLAVSIAIVLLAFVSTPAPARFHQPDRALAARVLALTPDHITADDVRGLAEGRQALVALLREHELLHVIDCSTD